MSDRLYIPFREFIWLEPLLRKFPEQLSKGDRLIYEQKKKLYDDFHLFVEWDVKKAILTFRKSLGIDIKVSRETASELIAAFQNAHKAFQAELTRKTEYPKLKNKEAEAEEKFLNMLFHNGEDKAINFIESLLNDHHKPQSWKESLA